MTNTNLRLAMLLKSMGSFPTILSTGYSFNGEL